MKIVWVVSIQQINPSDGSIIFDNPKRVFSGTTYGKKSAMAFAQKEMKTLSSQNNAIIECYTTQEKGCILSAKRGKREEMNQFSVKVRKVAYMFA